ncbi:MAG: ATP-binding cassette domain-containing protein, partial [Acidobacteriota bacterium]|nr:ATP-binding cassette domain-containing protein [Acidobacteriota bacterium]
MNTSGLHLTDVTRVYEDDAGRVEVLRGISLTMQPGNSLAITGPSGSGKSTLLHVIGTLDQPSSGAVSILGTDPFAMSEPDLARFR